MAGRGLVDQRYLDNLTPEQMRRELETAIEFQLEFLHALRELPDFPPPFVLHELNYAANRNDHGRGKKLQRDVSLEVIPPVSECEGGAGVWVVIRDAMRSREQ